MGGDISRACEGLGLEMSHLTRDAVYSFFVAVFLFMDDTCMYNYY